MNALDQADLFSEDGSIALRERMDVRGAPVEGQGELSDASLARDQGQAKHVEVFVPTERMGGFTRKVDRLQALAKKLDLPAWTVTVGPKEWRSVSTWSRAADLQAESSSLKREGAVVSIVGQAPVLEGWRFLAKIEHGAGGNLVKRMGDGDSSPPLWHSCGPDCDHCKVPRARNSTYMLQNVGSGEVKQVGSTCVSDFLGGPFRDPERIAAMYSFLDDMERDSEFDVDFEAGGGIGSCGVDPDTLMAAVLKIVQEDSGYLSAEKAESLGCASTGERLRAAFWSAKPAVVVPDAGHIERAPEVLTWLRAQKGSESLWLRNIAYLSDRPCIANKDAALFASGYVAWNRELQRELKAVRGVGDWVGIVGEKVTTAATLDRHGGYETAYGFKTVLSFRDEEGNGLVWKTQAPPHGLVVGSAYHCIATVKGFGTYGGEKQTEIIRVKVAELELFSFGALPAFKKLAAIASADVANESGHTPLLLAVIGDKVDHAMVLITNGAEVNQLGPCDNALLGFAVSTEMASALLTERAQAQNVTDEVLAAMPLDVRALVEQHQLRDMDPVVVARAGLPVVGEGRYSGRVLSVDQGIVTQKVNRSGDTVLHDAALLSVGVLVGEVVDIQYASGRGLVGQARPAREVGR